MAYSAMSESALRAKVRRACEKAGSISEFCRIHGLGRTHVNEFLAGMGPPTRDLLDALGLYKRVTYIKKPTIRRRTTVTVRVTEEDYSWSWDDVEDMNEN